MAGFGRVESRALLVFGVFLIFASFSSAISSMFVEVHAPDVAANGTNWTFTGWVLNASNVSQGIQNVNVTLNFNATHAPSALSNGTGYVTVNVSVPIAPVQVQYNFTFYANDSSAAYTNLTKNASFFAGDMPNATLAFITSTPPFSQGSTFFVNVTIKGAAGLPVVGHVAPPIAVYKPDGVRQTWTIVNNSAVTNASGSVAYNVTVPAGASGGTYLLLVDGIQQDGAGVLSFGVSESVYASVVTKDTNGQSRTVFAPNASVVIEVTIMNSSSLVAASSVTGLLVYPNASTKTMEVVENVRGLYNVTVTAPDAGDYRITVYSVSPQNFDLTSYGAFTTQAFSTRLDFLTSGPQKEFGGVRAFAGGSNAKLVIALTNLTNGLDLVAAANVNEAASGQVNCSKYNNTALTITNLNSSGTVSAVVVNASVLPFRGANYCAINFTVPTGPGDYRVSLPVTFGSFGGSALGVITTANYIVNLRPVFALGSSMMPVDFVYPGTNVSFVLSAYNLSSGATLSSGNITNATLMSLIPVMYSSGSTSSTIAYQNYSNSSGNPVLSFTAPSDGGPYRFTVIANVSNQNVTGEGFFISTALAGHVEPARSGMQMGPPTSNCSSNQTFKARVFDVRTNQFAVGVYINSVQDFREERTGRKIDNCLSITSTSTSQSDSSNRETSVQGTFGAGCGTLSEGFYFMLLNVSYGGRSEVLPGGFLCQQQSSLNFFPMLMPATMSTNVAMGPPKISRNTPVLVLVQGVFNGTGQVQRGYMTITQAQRHSPDAHDLLSNSTFLNGTLVNGQANITVYPQNFSLSGTNLTGWLPQFMDFTVRVCDWSGNCGTQMAGFEVQSFDAFLDPTSFQSLFQALPGNNVSVRINASTNLSTVGNITIEAGKPWEGIMNSITPFNITREIDAWNTSADMGYEQWFVNFTIPASLPRDGFEVTFKLKNYVDDVTQLHSWVGTPPMAAPSSGGGGGFGGPTEMGGFQTGGGAPSSSKYRVTVPFQEQIPVYDDNLNYQPVNASNAQFGMGGPLVTGQIVDGWNISILNGTYSILSKSNQACFKRQFNATRFLPSSISGVPASYTYNASWKMMVVDNTTAGTYNLLVINDTQFTGGNGRIFNMSVNNRAIAAGVYLWNVEDCASVSILNSSLTANSSLFNNYGGMFDVTQPIRFPVVVFEGMIPVANGNVTVSAIIQQQDFGGGGQNMGGAGFSEAVASSEYAVNPSQVTTDALGVAFLTINMVNTSRVGPLNLLWGLQAPDGVNYTAYMQEGIMFESKSSQTSVNSYTNQHPATVFNLTFLAANSYGAIFTETTGNEFTNDGYIQQYTFNYTPSTSTLTINETNQSNGVQVIQSRNASRVDQFQFANMGSTEYLLSALRNQTIGYPNGRMQLKYLQQTMGAPPTHTLNATANNSIYVMVAAHSFARTLATAASGTLSLRLTQENFGSVTQQTLMLRDPINGSFSTSVSTSLQGYTGIEAKPSSSWPTSAQGYAKIDVVLTTTGANETVTTATSFGGDVIILGS